MAKRKRIAIGSGTPYATSGGGHTSIPNMVTSKKDKMYLKKKAGKAIANKMFKKVKNMAEAYILGKETDHPKITRGRKPRVLKKAYAVDSLKIKNGRKPRKLKK